MFSLTRSKASIVSRLADFLQFSTKDIFTGYVGGMRGLGEPSVSQTSKGVFYPTVQGAIEDIATRYEMPIGTIIMNDTGVKPRVISQTDQWKFTGQVIGAPTEDIVIYVFGIPVVVKGGDTEIAVASKAFDVLIAEQAENRYFQSVAIDGVDPTILNITYNDYQSHVFEEESQYGVKQTQTTVVQPQAAYGDWDELGSEAKTLAGGTVNGGNITIYYFKRTS